MYIEKPYIVFVAVAFMLLSTLLMIELYRGTDNGSQVSDSKLETGNGLKQGKPFQSDTKSEITELNKMVSELVRTQNAFQARVEKKFDEIDEQRNAPLTSTNDDQLKPSQARNLTAEGYAEKTAQRRSHFQQTLESQIASYAGDEWAQETVEDVQLKFTQIPELSKGQLAVSECGLDLCKFKIVYESDSTFEDRMDFDNHFLLSLGATLPRATSFLEKTSDGNSAQVFYMAKKGSYLPGESSNSNTRNN